MGKQVSPRLIQFIGEQRFNAARPTVKVQQNRGVRRFGVMQQKMFDPIHCNIFFFEYTHGQLLHVLRLNALRIVSILLAQFLFYHNAIKLIHKIL